MKLEYIEFIRDSLKLDIKHPEFPSNVHNIFECLLCGNSFEAYPKAKVQAFKKFQKAGCPSCTKQERFSPIDDANKQKVLDMGYIIYSEYKNRKEKMEVSNSNCPCGRKWWVSAAHIFSGRAFCRPCNDDRKRKRFEKLNKERFTLVCSYSDKFHNYKKLVKHYTEKNYKKYKHIINPNNFLRGKGKGDDIHNLDHIVSQSFCWKKGIPAKVCADVSNLRMIDAKSNLVKNDKSINNFPKIFDSYLDYRTKRFAFIKEIQDEFDNCFEEDYVINDHTFDLRINDIVISLLLFEENKESFNLNKRLNLNNYTLANADGKHYIPIFEHEWGTHKKLIKKKIAHMIGHSNNEKIYARKCSIREISNDEKKKFLEANHIQGNCNSKIKLGCFFGDVLVSVLTFSTPRVIMGKKFAEGVYELARFASDVNYTVVGTASKMLKYFKNNYKWKEIYSYADKRWSKSGNLYKTLGFVQQPDTTQNYYYVKDGKAFHRFKFAKHNIKKLYPETFNPTKTEYQNMIDVGFDRVWDCGNFKFTLNN